MSYFARQPGDLSASPLPAPPPLRPRSLVLRFAILFLNSLYEVQDGAYQQANAADKEPQNGNDLGFHVGITLKRDIGLIAVVSPRKVAIRHFATSTLTRRGMWNTGSGNGSYMRP